VPFAVLPCVLWRVYWWATYLSRAPAIRTRHSIESINPLLLCTLLSHPCHQNVRGSMMRMLIVHVWTWLAFTTLFLLAVAASPPSSTAQTFGVNQQRTGFVPIKGVTTISWADTSNIRAITSPVYSSDTDFLVVTAITSGTFNYCNCTALSSRSFNTVGLPEMARAAGTVGIPVLSSDDRAYFVSATYNNQKGFVLAYSHSCDFQYALELPAGGSLSPIILADNSLVLGIGNQIQVIANSSDPIGGVPIWNTTLDTYARSIGLALSADNSTGVLFVSFVIAYVTNDRYNVSLMAMAPLAQGVPGFSPLWTQRVVVASRDMYCGGASFCPLTPVVCGTQVLLTTPTAIMAFDQATGSLRWTFNGSFVGAYHQPACHPSGMMVVMDGDATLVAFQAVGTLVSELWRRSTGAFHVVRAPVIDAVGNVYVIGGAVMSDTNPAKLLAFDHVGNLLISRSTNVPPSAATAPQYTCLSRCCSEIELLSG